MNAADAVTMSVHRHVREECQAQFEEWIVGIGAAAQTFEGNMGMGIVRPAQGMPLEYTLVIRFDSYEHFQVWQESPDRLEWLERSLPYLEREAVETVAPGLEFWFTPPASKVLRQPSRLKMAMITLTALYPLSLLINILLGPVILSWPLALRVFASSALVVFLMTYVVMPPVVKFFAPWLKQGQ
jgi:uncharacterized protein